MIYPLSALRAIVLHTQLLTTPNGASPTPDTMVDLVTALGYVQIDTLHVANRAHYVTLWARLGSYYLDDFDKLIYTADQRSLYEGWGHAASIIPLEHYRYHRWRTDQKYTFNTTPVPAEEARRFCLEQAAKALGVFDSATSSHGMARRVSRLRRAIRRRSAKK